MAQKKRVAEFALTQNNWQEDADDSENKESALPVEASATKLASRTVFKARRKRVAKPQVEIKLGSFEGGTAPTFKFDFSKPAETKDETKAPAVNAFAALQNKSDWECSACEVRNEKNLIKCAACEAPKPGTAAAPGFTFGAAPTFGTVAPFTFGGGSSGSSSLSGGTPTAFNFDLNAGFTPGVNFGAPFAFSAANTFTFGGGSTGPVSFGDMSGSTFGATTPGFAFGGVTFCPVETFTFGSAPVTFGNMSGSTFSTSFEPTNQLATGAAETKQAAAEFKFDREASDAQRSEAVENKEPEKTGAKRRKTEQTAKGKNNSKTQKGKKLYALRSAKRTGRSVR